MDSQDLSLKSVQSSQFSDIVQIQPVVVKAVYDQLKFKFSIKEEDSTFKQIKSLIVEKINNKQNSNLEIKDIQLQDDSDFEYEDEDKIRDHSDNLQLSVKVVGQKQQKQNNTEQIQNVKQVSEQQNQKQNQEQQQEEQKQNDDALQALKQDQELQKQQYQQSEPTEAIVVLYDVSGSMKCRFYGEEHLNRIGATNAFFSAFADKTLAFEFNHIVSLYCFDSKIQKLCDFIPDLDKFINLVDNVQSGGATRLYDTVHMAIQDLILIRQKYPNIICRILALTDGEDNQSTHLPLDLAKEIVKNNIIMDSFVVSDNCKGIKNMTHCSGGRCYQPKDINQGLKLFEIETIISAKSRGTDNLFDKEKIDNIDSLDLQQYDQQPFDTEGVEMEKPKEMQIQGMSAEEILKKVMELQKKQEEQSKINPQQTNTKQQSGGGVVKRIQKELQGIQQLGKEELIKFFPTSDIFTWKVLLIGPKGTTYNKGIYTLLVNFPQDYPFKPPKIQFMTKVYHCNISSQGQLCLDILKDQWSPALTVEKVLRSILLLLENPNADDALDSTIASFYKDKDRQTEYKNTLLQETLKYADRGAEEVLQEIYGNQGKKQDIDVEYNKQLQEIQEWMIWARK